MNIYKMNWEWEITCQYLKKKLDQSSKLKRIIFDFSNSQFFISTDL